MSQDPHDPEPSSGDPPTPGAFTSLLQGREAWWHFLEAKSLDEHADGGSPERVDDHGLELAEVGRLAERHERERRPTFHIARTQSLRCEECAAQIPADLTFCVHCGATPRFMAAMTWHRLVVERVERREVLNELAEIIGRGNQALSPKELAHALSQPPAVFYFYGRSEHAEALTDRLFESGITAHASPTRQPSEVSMTREVAESIVRNPVYLSGWVIAASIWAIVAISGAVGWAALGAILTFFALGSLQAARYKKRYEFRAAEVLNALTGFDAVLAQQAAHTLKRLEDQRINELLSVALMEYYAIWRHVSAAPPPVRPLLSEVKEHLDDLLVQIIGSCAKYAELHAYASRHNAEALAERLEALGSSSAPPDQASAASLNAHREELHRQVETAHQAAAVLTPFASRLERMLATLETLRARVVAITLRAARHDAPSAHDEEMRLIMLDLDAELLAVEDVLDVVLTP